MEIKFFDMLFYLFIIFYLFFILNYFLMDYVNEKNSNFQSGEISKRTRSSSK
jgi:hypothetical protein